MLEPPVVSPCVSICALNDDDVCTGCFRTIAEIRGWSYLCAEQKKYVLLLCNERSGKKKPV
ncbi:MAG: DUF1289 domain-containing protein [Proteobacteria bacterium]|jgi:uncharacterized protein|nr:DUF1289 domain-containing protein [Pseudomonadota bacterium]MDA1351495.1 DUF1289 domain-containing protein [Pseudomonadota bacterium]